MIQPSEPDSIEESDENRQANREREWQTRLHNRYLPHFLRSDHCQRFANWLSAGSPYFGLSLRFPGISLPRLASRQPNRHDA